MEIPKNKFYNQQLCQRLEKLEGYYRVKDQLVRSLGGNPIFASHYQNPREFLKSEDLKIFLITHENEDLLKNLVEAKGAFLVDYAALRAEYGGYCGVGLIEFLQSIIFKKIFQFKNFIIRNLDNEMETHIEFE